MPKNCFYFEEINEKNQGERSKKGFKTVQTSYFDIPSHDKVQKDDPHQFWWK